MPNVPLPFSIIQWMRDRDWGHHHLEWHTTRQWDRLSPAEQAEASSLGWARAAKQEGEATNGFEFLMMHRAMLGLLREAFPSQTALFAGWSTPPTNPGDPDDPVPAGNPQPFRPAMATAITRLTNSLTSFGDDDELGLYIQTRAQPVFGNPFNRSPDESRGIHNYLHNRFADTSSLVNMGDPEKNLENPQFWRLHGWIDARWTAFRSAKGLSDSDPAFQQALERERHHLVGHMMPSGTHLFAMAAAPPRKPLGQVSSSLRNPFGESLARRFQRVMATIPDITTLDDLKEYLQTAIMLEHATLPPYLCAMWSVQTSTPANNAIVAIIRGIVFQEMLHMGMACNLLLAVGGKPKINTPGFVLQFPDYLPGVQLMEKVDLRPLSMDRVKLFMKIEAPLDPIPPSLVAAAGVPRFPTIGEFYAAIDRGFVNVNPALITVGQLAIKIRTDKLTVIGNLEQARDTIQLIQEQGEGTPATRGAIDHGNGLAHYYQFQQIVEQKRFVLQPGTTTYKLGPPLPFPAPADIYPMAPVPDIGYPGVPESQAFDDIYSRMLAKLQKAWDDADSGALSDAVDFMQNMGDAATTLMAKAIPPGGQGNYGPAFRLVPVPPDATPAPIAPTAAASEMRRVPRMAPQTATAAMPTTAPAPTYARIQQLLDEAVHGETIGAHGPFWRTLARDQFVAKSIFGKKLIASRPDGTFDPNESNLVKALEGRAPFGADLTPPPAGAIYNRMPDGFDSMPQVRIDEIRAWITAGCPDALPVEPPWIAAAGSPLPDQRVLDFWREFDDWSMFQATPEVSDAIGAFFEKAPLWLGFAADPTREPAWQAALQEAPVRAAVSLLEGRQRDTIVKNFGRPVPLGSLLDAFRRFGDDSLPNDTQRPADMRHNMNGKVMWFMWSAFLDACLRLSIPSNIPAPFWSGMARAVLVGLMNDGLIRGRFTVEGFPATLAGQDLLQQSVIDLPDANLPGELARRFRESGLPVPPA